MNLEMVKQARQELVASALRHKLEYPVGLDGLSDVAKQLAKKLFEAIQEGYDELPIAALKPYFNEQNSPNFNYKFAGILASILDQSHKIIATNNNLNGNGEIKNLDFSVIVEKLAPHIAFFSVIQKERYKAEYVPLVYPFVPDQVGCFPFVTESGEPWVVKLNGENMLVPTQKTVSQLMARANQKLKRLNDPKEGDVFRIMSLIANKEVKTSGPIKNLLSLHLNSETSVLDRARLYEKQEYREVSKEEAGRFGEPALAGQFGVFVKQGQSIKKGEVLGLYTGVLCKKETPFLRNSTYYREIRNVRTPDCEWVVDGAFGMVALYNTRTVERDGKRFEAEPNDPRFNTYLVQVPATFSHDGKSFEGTIYITIANTDIEAGQELTQHYFWQSAIQ